MNQVGIVAGYLLMVITSFLFVITCNNSIETGEENTKMINISFILLFASGILILFSLPR